MSCGHLFSGDRSRRQPAETSNLFESDWTRTTKKYPGEFPGISSFIPCARGFEPPTFWSVARRSIQLSYAHISMSSYMDR